jgi:hypothetical protein
VQQFVIIGTAMRRKRVVEVERRIFRNVANVGGYTAP